MYGLVTGWVGVTNVGRQWKRGRLHSNGYRDWKSERVSNLVSTFFNE